MGQTRFTGSQMLPTRVSLGVGKRAVQGGCEGSLATVLEPHVLF